MTTQNKSESGNGYLTALGIIGLASMFIGGIIWLANSSEPRYGEDPNLMGQAIGGSLLGAGVSFIALWLAAAAICRQIADPAPREARKRP